MRFDEFISTALPYFLIGLAIAIFFAGSAKKEKHKEEKTFDSYGMGTLFGVAIGIAIGSAADNLLLLMGIGALAGAVIDLIRIK